MEINRCPNCCVLFKDSFKWNPYNIQTHIRYCSKKYEIIKNCKSINNFFG